MKNSAKVHSDGINIYITSQVHSHPVGRWILTILAISIGSLLLVGFAMIPGAEIGKFLIPVFLVSFLYYYFIVRYTLWNWFGKELIIISTKCVSYQLDYGFYLTKLKTIDFSRFGLSSEVIQKVNDLNLSKIYFFNYHEEDNLPQAIYETAILLPEAQVDEIKEQVWLLFEPAQANYNEFPFSLN